MTREIQKVEFLANEDEFKIASEGYTNGKPCEFTTIWSGISEVEAYLITEIDVKKGLKVLGRSIKLGQKTCQSHAVEISALT